MGLLGEENLPEIPNAAAGFTRLKCCHSLGLFPVSYYVLVHRL